MGREIKIINVDPMSLAAVVTAMVRIVGGETDLVKMNTLQLHDDFDAMFTWSDAHMYGHVMIVSDLISLKDYDAGKNQIFAEVADYLQTFLAAVLGSRPHNYVLSHARIEFGFMWENTPNPHWNAGAIPTETPMIPTVTVSRLWEGLT